MAKLFLFGIGGSGERVLRSFNMLLAAGVDGLEKYDIYPIIIDYDIECKDQDIVRENLELYKKIHNNAFAKHADATKNQFFGARMIEMQGLERFTFPYAPPASEKKYSDHIGYSSLLGKSTKDLMDALYNNSNDSITELNLDLTVGFKGNPNIGSVVFNDIKNKPEFQSFLTMFDPSNDRVVVIGSLFGGTGASGIPELVKAIRAEKPTACIGTVFLLPYFTMQRPDGGAINPNLFYSKTKAALSFYKNSGTNKLINSRYYVGDANPTRVEYCEGGKGQQNNAHMVELIAAMFIAYFANDNNAPGQMNVPHKFSLSTLSNGEHISAEIADEGLGDSAQFFYKDFDQTTKGYLQRLVQLCVALKYMVEEIQGGTKDAKNTTLYTLLNLDKLNLKEESTRNEQPLQDLCYYLGIFHKKLKTWLDELDSEKHPHRFTLLSPNDSREYKDFVATPFVATQEEKGGRFLGIKLGKGNKDEFTCDNIETALDNALHEAHRKGEKDVATKANEFVLLDTLRRAMNSDDIMKKLKFKSEETK